MTDVVKGYQFKKFDMRKIDQCRKLVFLGKTGSGKTWLIRDCMYYLRNIPEGIVIAGTISARENYRDFIPDTYIYQSYSKHIITNFIKNQQRKISKGVKNPGGFIIMDDLLHEKNKWVKSEEMAYIYMNSRNDHTLHILSMQHPIGIGPELRTNIDYTFISRENIISNRRKIHDHYAGMFPTLKVFNTVMDQCTENYECLVIDNQAKSNKIEDQVFWYKAKERKNFKVGSRSYWKHHYEVYDESYNNRLFDAKNEIEEIDKRYSLKDNKFFVEKLESHD